jgi:Aldehyde dehydrogenase family
MLAKRTAHTKGAGVRSLAGIGGEMTSNPIVRKLAFTGSDRGRQLLMQQCAGTVKKLSLELGGNAPFIVFYDADIEMAVKSLPLRRQGVRSPRNTATPDRPKCAPNRILVEDGVYDAFTKRLAETAGAMKVADGFEPGAVIGSLISGVAGKVRSRSSLRVTHMRKDRGTAHRYAEHRARAERAVRPNTASWASSRPGSLPSAGIESRGRAMLCLSAAPPPALAMTAAGQNRPKEDVQSLLETFGSSPAIGNVEALVALFAANRANARARAAKPNGHATALALSQFVWREVQTHDAHRCS